MDFESLNAELKDIGLVISANGSSTVIKTWWPKIVSSIILVLVGFLLMLKLIDAATISYTYFTTGVFESGFISFLITGILGFFGLVAFSKGTNRLIDSLGFKVTFMDTDILISKRINLSLNSSKQTAIVHFKASVVGEYTHIDAGKNDGLYSTIFSEKNEVSSNQNTLIDLAEYLNTRLEVKKI